MSEARNLFLGEKVYLDGLAETDIPLLSRWWTKPEVMRYFDALPVKFRSHGDWTKWLKETDANTYRFAIRSVEEQKLIGYAEIEGILWVHGIGWLSILIGEEENHGKGYGRETMEKVITFAFQELNLHRLQLTVFSYNQKPYRYMNGLDLKRKVLTGSSWRETQSDSICSCMVFFAMNGRGDRTCDVIFASAIVETVLFNYR